MPPTAVAADVQVLRDALAAQLDADFARLTDRFFEDIDSGTQQLAIDARNAAEMQVALDLGAALAMNRSALERELPRALFRHLRVPFASRRYLLDSEGRLLSRSALDESVALAHLTAAAQRATGSDGDLLQARLHWALPSEDALRYAAAYGAAAPGEIFADAFSAVELSAQQRVMAVRLLEDAVLPAWVEVQRHAHLLLDSHRIARDRFAAMAPAAWRLPTPSRAAMTALRAAAEGAEGSEARGYLRELVEGGPAQGALLLGLAWLDGLLSQRGVGPELRARLEAQRLKLLRLFISDRGFFVQPHHPLRLAFTEVVDESTRHAWTAAETLHTANALAELLDRVQLGGPKADLAKPAAPISQDELERFQKLLRDPTPETADEARTPPVHDPVAVLLKPGRWLRVTDPRGDSRWVMVAARYAAHDRISFAGSDGVPAFALRASTVVDDLRSGRAEPLNPDAEARVALQMLRAGSAAGRVRAA